MKSILLFLSLCLFGAAEASQTITLDTMPCTATNICFNVPNDSGVSVDYISDAIQYRRLVMSVGGEIFDSGIWALNGQLNQTDVPLYAANGSVLYATLVFTVTTGKCVQQGRTCVTPRHVTLVSGTLFLP